MQILEVGLQDKQYVVPILQSETQEKRVQQDDVIKRTPVEAQLVGNKQRTGCTVNQIFGLGLSVSYWSLPFTGLGQRA